MKYFVPVMAHLEKLPTYFVKGDERRAAYYSVTARELLAAGFTPEDGEVVIREPIKEQPEIVVEAGTTAYDSTDAPQEPQAEEDDLDGMNKAELIDWAADHGVEVKPYATKSSILEACKEVEEQGDV